MTTWLPSHYRITTITRVTCIREEHFQIEDGITDELSGAMISDVASPVYMVKGNALYFQGGFIKEQVFAVAVASQGIGVGMFEKEQLAQVIGGVTEGGDMNTIAECGWKPNQG